MSHTNINGDNTHNTMSKHCQTDYFILSPISVPLQQFMENKHTPLHNSGINNNGVDIPYKLYQSVHGSPNAQRLLGL